MPSFTATFAKTHSANFTIDGGTATYALEATASSASLVGIPNNDLQLTANNLLVEAREGLDLSAAKGLPVVQTSGGPVTLDFSGLGAGAAGPLRAPLLGQDEPGDRVPARGAAPGGRETLRPAELW